MSVITGQEPQQVLKIFEEIAAIPHGSHNTKAISDYLMAFAKKRGFRCRQDELNNVVIFADGTEGYENSPHVILQGHMDMVCEKANGISKDMEKEGLDLAICGDYLYAEGTTLGGDDGVALAMALAVLDDPTIPHPPLDIIFTVDEEVGMLGARGLDCSDIQGRLMLNMDSEEEGVITVSCAGGNRAYVKLPLTRKVSQGNAYEISVSGCQGGHSGEEINKGRGSAVKLLARLLLTLWEEDPYSVIWVEGGRKDNAIPTDAKAIIQLEAGRDPQGTIKEFQEIISKEYAVADPHIKVEIAPTISQLDPWDHESTSRLITFLTCTPNGVEEMSQSIPGLTQTSLNLGILETKDFGMYASYCVRSNMGTQKFMLNSRLRMLATQLGGEMEVFGVYPAWEYRPESKLRERAISVFEKIYKKKPEIVAIHGGVECGLFGDKLPGLDCIAFGPNLMDIHTCREKCSLSSLNRTWQLLCGILQELK